MTVITSERTPISAVAPLKVALFWLEGRLFSIASEGRPILKGQMNQWLLFASDEASNKVLFSRATSRLLIHIVVFITLQNSITMAKGLNGLLTSWLKHQRVWKWDGTLNIWPLRTFLKFEPIRAPIMAYIFKATTVDTIQVKIFLTKALL